MTILVPTRGAEDWRALLADPAKHWRHGCSAMSAAMSWEAAAGGLPPEVAAILGPDARLLLAIPEHKVTLPGGGRDSQCDVFALVDLGAAVCAVAIEAKVDEPFDKTVGEWLSAGGDNRRVRLSGLLAVLDLSEAPSALRYQLLHRTAAAVIEARRFHLGAAAMIVQSFSPERRWFDDFAALCRLFGVSAEPGRPAEVRLPSGCRLILGWASGSPPA